MATLLHSTKNVGKFDRYYFHQLIYLCFKDQAMCPSAADEHSACECAAGLGTEKTDKKTML